LVVPTVRTITLSLQKADLLTETEFVGLANYANLFQDGMFASTLSFTVLLVGERLLMVAIVPLLLALAISAFDRTLRLTTRLLFTIPLALAAPPMIALGWGLLLHPNFGLLAGRPWLGSPGTARLAVLGIDALYSFGVACGIGLIVYLAALRGQPEAGPVWKKLSR
jgi:ABC-type sugar transport system permease subunit